MSRELMQQALEKLEFFAHMKSVSEDTTKLITALRQALVDADDISLESVDETVKSEHALTQATGQWNPLCTAPQKKEWVGLTEEDLFDIAIVNFGEPDLQLFIEMGKLVQEELKEKNT
jgi:hypothetical protein